ncbi:GNAT family N-acetyltransferase [Deinococcus ruber]|uniref:GNAT family N-acetyltransferase n=1 Tax=Deinococcus ruber TaxID=1848197 RepID=UPI00166E5C0E|nr:N-acetyltransferase [Deinococcus ruber]
MEPAPLRCATASDLTATLSLIGEYYAFDGIGFDRDSLEQGLRTLLSEPLLGRVYLIESGTIESGMVVAGYTILTFGFDLEFGGRQATMTDLYLRPAFRGAGLGRASMAALEAVCQELEIGALELQVERDNRAAQAFYGRLGFQAHDRIPMSKRLSGATFDAR